MSEIMERICGEKEGITLIQTIRCKGRKDNVSDVTRFYMKQLAHADAYNKYAEKIIKETKTPPGIRFSFLWRGWRHWFTSHGWPGGFTYHVGPLKILVTVYSAGKVRAPLEEWNREWNRAPSRYAVATAFNRLQRYKDRMDKMGH